MLPDEVIIETPDGPAGPAVAPSPALEMTLPELARCLGHVLMTAAAKVGLPVESHGCYHFGGLAHAIVTAPPGRLSHVEYQLAHAVYSAFRRAGLMPGDTDAEGDRS